MNAKEQDNVSPKKRRFHHVCSINNYSLVGCEPHKVMGDYFGAQGLNPLAVLRSDVGAGCSRRDDESGVLELLDRELGIYGRYKNTSNRADVDA